MSSFPQNSGGPGPRPIPRRPAPAPARPRHLRVVRERPAPGRRPPASTLAIAGFATAAALFGMVSVQSLVGQTQIRQTEIQRRIDAKRDRLESLQVEVSNLTSLDRIAKRASELGLVDPPSIVFLPAPEPSAQPASSDATAPRGPARPGADTSPGRGGD